MSSNGPVAEIIAALTCGQRRAVDRARGGIELAPDEALRNAQRHVADREAERLSLLDARLAEVGSRELEDRYAPFFDAFFGATEPADWVEVQAFHYVGDALVAEFAHALLPALDAVSAEVVRTALSERDEQDAFALDQLTGAIEADPSLRERVAAYARAVAGEALTQTRRALDASPDLAGVLGDDEAQKRVLLDLLDAHRRRLDRLGIEPVEDEPGEED